MRLPVRLTFPDGVREVREPVVQELTDSLLERRTIDAGESGLGGKRIAFVGLEGTITDVLVRVAFRDGTVSTTLVRPSQPWIEIAGASGALAVMGAYFTRGIEHILFDRASSAKRISLPTRTSASRTSRTSSKRSASATATSTSTA
jgi:hypothetical protein